MSAKTQINKIKTLLGLEIKLEQMKLENGTILEAEAFEAGAEIFIVNEEDRIAVPMGEYMLEDGKVLIITEDGIIGEIKDAEEAPAEFASLEAFNSLVTRFEEAVEKLNSLEEKLNTNESAFNSMKEAFGKTVDLVEKVADLPSEEPTKAPAKLSKKEEQFANIVKIAKTLKK